MNYVPLYIKTNNSLLSSMIKIPELVKYAKQNNYTSLTITDNNLYGAMEFYNECIKNDIKPIIGLEININDYTIILYCMNYNGYQNLIKLSTIISERQIDIDDLKTYQSNLICIVPYQSRSLYDYLKPIYKNIFQSYQNDLEKQELKGNNLVYMKPILYIQNKDKKYINYLYCIRDSKLIEEVLIKDQDNYLKPPIKEETNSKIYELCNLVIPNNKNLLPVYECPNNMDSYTYLKKLCIEGLKKIFGKTVSKVYLDRLKYELNIINNMGFCNYFLIVWDYVKYAKEQGILVGPGRGSAAGSLVAYLLNITTIDPIKYNLIFERFLNPERITMPDIDIDFEDGRREEVINYCINKYGIKRVALIITFGTLGSRQVIRDVGRVMNLDVDYLSKLINSNLTLKENYDSNIEIKKYLHNNKEMVLLYEVSAKLEGLKRHTSIHAAGIVMANTDLDNIVPLDKSHGNFYTTGYSMEYLEDLGLLKMDFLALRNLTTITNILNDINKKEAIDFDSIPLNDKEAIKIFTDVNVVGIFQFESSGMMNFLRKFTITCFEDIVQALALFRPGPMSNIDVYIKRKKGLVKIDYLDKSLVDILKPTYGIIVYQEQIMQIANKMANYSYAEADVLRRAMSKKKESVLLKEKSKFINQSIKNGYQEDLSNKVYELILKFANYGFNRAHSVAYAMIAYKMAYLKAHYPLIFMKNLLDMVMGSEIKTKEYIYECKLNNIDIIRPDINVSGKAYLVSDSTIRFPLTGIKNVGIGAINTILEQRNKKPFSDIFDFVGRCYGKTINRKTLANLIKAGCFTSLGYNKHTLDINLDVIINYSEIGGYLDEQLGLKPELKIVSEYSKKELMEFELEVFGFYLSNHPVTEYRQKYKDTVLISEIGNYFDKNVNVIVYVDKTKMVKTKIGQEMLFITGSDEVNVLDIVLFPRTYEKYHNIIVGSVIYISGKVEKRFDKYQLVANEIVTLNTSG